MNREYNINGTEAPLIIDIQFTTSYYKIERGVHKTSNRDKKIWSAAETLPDTLQDTPKTILKIL